MSSVGKLQSNAPQPAARSTPAPVETATVPGIARDDFRGASDATIFYQPTRQNAVTLHPTGAASQQALLAAISAAQRSFCIETFEFHDDRTGNEVIQAIAARKRRAKQEGKPFECRVLLDWEGMQDRPGDAAVVQKLRAAGAEVIVYHPGYVANGRLAPLTHRKLYVQDGDRFLTGGRNIGDEYMRDRFSDAKTGASTNGWHDMLMTVEGMETERILASFYQDWEAVGGHVPDEMPTTHPSARGDVTMQSFGTDPERNIFSIRRAHTALIAAARKELVLVVPYLSDNTLIDQLIAAKRKRPTLSVKVLLPAVAESSTGGQLFDYLNDQSARKLAAAGVEVRFQGGKEDRFTHMKAMVVDNRLLSLGSANGDARSYEHNHELITVMDDPATVKQLKSQVLDADWAEATPLDPAGPAKQASPGIQLLSVFKGIL